LESGHNTGTIARGYWLRALLDYSKLERAYQAVSVGLDIVESPLNVNGKNCLVEQGMAGGLRPASAIPITIE